MHIPTSSNSVLLAFESWSFLSEAFWLALDVIMEQSIILYCHFSERRLSQLQKCEYCRLLSILSMVLLLSLAAFEVIGEIRKYTMEGLKKENETLNSENEN